MCLWTKIFTYASDARCDVWLVTIVRNCMRGLRLVCVCVCVRCFSWDLKNGNHQDVSLWDSKQPDQAVPLQVYAYISPHGCHFRVIVSKVFHVHMSVFAKFTVIHVYTVAGSCSTATCFSQSFCFIHTFLRTPVVLPGTVHTMSSWRLRLKSSTVCRYCHLQRVDGVWSASHFQREGAEKTCISARANDLCSWLEELKIHFWFGIPCHGSCSNYVSKPQF